MNASIEKNDDKLYDVHDEPVAEISQFVQVLIDDGQGFEICTDHYAANRLKLLKIEISDRNSCEGELVNEDRISANFIIQQAAYRYYLVIKKELKLLRFNREEVILMLNANCVPIWDWSGTHNLASMILNGNDIEDLKQLSAESAIQKLLKKLAKLTEIQEVAIIDFCERFWRVRSSMDFDDRCEQLGLKLIS